MIMGMFNVQWEANLGDPAVYDCRDLRFQLMMGNEMKIMCNEIV